MYLSQVFSSKNKLVYSIVSVIMLLLLFMESFTNNAGENTDKVMKEMISQIGELPFYAFSLLSFGVFLSALFFIVKIVHEQTLTQFTTSRKKIDYKRILFSFLVYGGFLLGGFLLDMAINPQNYVWNFQPIKFLLLVIISLLLLPIQIGFEEYFFRGYFMQWLALLSKNKWLPLLLSSVVFGLAHSTNPEVLKMGYGMMFYYIGAGLFLGVISLMDDGLELSLGAHLSNNFLGAILLTSEHSVFRTPSLFKDISTPTMDYLQVFIIYIIYIMVIFIFAKKYKWAFWKEKLFGKVL